MPYVQVWVDDVECGPCQKCKGRDRSDKGIIYEVLQEWYFRKAHGDYERFERWLASQDERAWRKIVYGVPAALAREGQ